MGLVSFTTIPLCSTTKLKGTQIENADCDLGQPNKHGDSEAVAEGFMVSAIYFTGSSLLLF